MARIVAALLILALLAGSVAIAEDPAGKAPEENGAEKKDAKDEKADKPEKPQTPLGRLLAALETLVASERTKPDHDKKLLKRIESRVKLFSKEKEKPVSLDDLSEEDRERLEAQALAKARDELREAGQDGGGGGGPGDWWAQRYQEAVAKALDGEGLKEDQREKCKEILDDFVKEYDPALRRGDYKLANDLKNDAEKRLRKVVGGKKAKDIMNNINRQLPSRGGWGGGGWGGGGGR